MDGVVDRSATSPTDRGQELLELYDSALPSVYGYLLRRCGSVQAAEDLTSESFLAAVDSLSRGVVGELTTAWMIGIARHKLVDHWRRRERDDRRFALMSEDPTTFEIDDRWPDLELDRLVAMQVLSELGLHHRSALTLRYLDGLSVTEVAQVLDRTPGATEVLLVRARRAFRERYELMTREEAP